MIFNIKCGDIIKEQSDVIVNPANSYLLKGKGISKAIYDAAGEVVVNECGKIREQDFPDGIPTGKAVFTSAGNLPCKYIIHTVGPFYKVENPFCEELLYNSYKNSLKIAVSLECKSISFPSISTGAFCFPKEEAAKVAFRAINDFNSNELEINFVFFSEEDKKIFENTIKKEFNYGK